MKRKYELKKRAQRQEETRQRIVEAAVGLHTSVGSAHTTISAIAERAGVERHTVYAHFPDDQALFAACAAHWRSAHPFPDVSESLALDDPQARLRGALASVYAWYESVESDLVVLIRDADALPEHADEMARTAEAMHRLAAALAHGLPRRKAVRAALGHALEFETWRSLVRRQGLSRAAAVDAMVRLVAGA